MNILFSKLNRYLKRLKMPIKTAYFNIHSNHTEAKMCKTFGCGRTLTLREQLFGDDCFECSGSDKVIGKRKTDDLRDVINKILTHFH